MDAATTWSIIGVLAVIILGVALWAFRTWRKTQDESERLAFVFDLVDLVLEALVRETKRELAQIPETEIAEAARAVWRQYIEPSPFAAFVPEQVFVDLALGQWRQVIGVGQAVTIAVARIQALERDRRMQPAHLLTRPESPTSTLA